MRKTFILIVSLLFCIPIWSSVRTEGEALAIAKTNSKDPMSAVGRSLSVSLVKTYSQKGGAAAAVYVYQRANGKGFLLISAETETPAILGQTSEGTFDANNEGLKIWIQRYQQEIALIRKGQAKAWKTGNYKPVTPLCGTWWSQIDPYNNQCPLSGGKRSLTGCVAVALGQLMYHHKKPNTFEWDKMLVMITNNSNPSQIAPIAKLLHQVGVAAKTEYSSKASSASVETGLKGIAGKYGYSNYQFYNLEKKGTQTCLQAIANDLQAGRPVILSASLTMTEGHAFVVEGINNNGYLFCNWGWGGLCNGYFALSLVEQYPTPTKTVPSVDIYVGIR